MGAYNTLGTVYAFRSWYFLAVVNMDIDRLGLERTSRFEGTAMNIISSHRTVKTDPPTCMSVGLLNSSHLRRQHLEHREAIAVRSCRHIGLPLFYATEVRHGQRP